MPWKQLCLRCGGSTTEQLAGSRRRFIPQLHDADSNPKNLPGKKLDAAGPTGIFLRESSIGLIERVIRRNGRTVSADGEPGRTLTFIF